MVTGLTSPPSAAQYHVRMLNIRVRDVTAGHLLLTLTLAGCGDGIGPVSVPPPPPPPPVRIAPSDTTIGLAESVQFALLGATGNVVWHWASADTATLRLDQTGKARGWRPGKTQLSACPDTGQPCITATVEVRPADPVWLGTLCPRMDSILATIPPWETFDATLAAYATILPGGWGGGSLTFMYLLDPDVEPLFRAASDRVAECAGRPRALEAPTVREGQYSYDQLFRWYRHFQREGGAVMTTMSSISNGTNRLTLGVATMADIDVVRAKLASLGVPLDAVVVDTFMPMSYDVKAGSAAPAWSLPLP